MSNKPTRYFSNNQESKVSQKLGLKRTANSGATDYQKGDASDKHILYELKTLTKVQKSHTIQKEWLDKNLDEALSMGKQISALIFNFGPNTKNYVILDVEDFKNIYESWKKENGGE